MCVFQDEQSLKRDDNDEITVGSKPEVSVQSVCIVVCFILLLCINFDILFCCCVFDILFCCCVFVY